MNLEYTKIKKALQQRRSNDGLFIVTRKRLLSKKKKATTIFAEKELYANRTERQRTRGRLELVVVGC